MNIRVEKLKKLIEESYGSFDSKEVCVEPYDYGFKSCMISELDNLSIEEARKKALEIDEVCVVFVENPAGEEFVVSSRPSWYDTFVLFNAERSNNIAAEMRTITYNKGKGALTVFLHDKRVVYKKGSVLIF